MHKKSLVARITKGPTAKGSLHPRNLHHDRYDLDQLAVASPDLKTHIITNQYDVVTIDFTNSESVKLLNKALLIKYYNIQYWDLPQDYLCPPIPGRSDYIHYVADLINKIDKSSKVNCLDIGVGANCIYPIIGKSLYDWNFVGTEVDEVALQNAQNIVDRNDTLHGKINFRLQKTNAILDGIVQADNYFDVAICNPPFHASADEALQASTRKVNNLSKSSGKKTRLVKLNFGGKANELWTAGGEKAFITQMIKESVGYKNQFGWFTSLVSKEDNLPYFYQLLKSLKAGEVKTIDMQQGQKTSRFIAWRF
jgi:23S rRNA (adenine1618-N6)-methyltransferase